MMPKGITHEINDVRLEIQPAEEIHFPSNADSNSPCWWSRDRFYILNSTGHSIRSSGTGFSEMTEGQPIVYTGWRDGGRWIESVCQEPDVTLLGWYHNEPAHLIPDEYQQGRQFPLTAPFIGAVISRDNGHTWDDLGLVLTGGKETLNIEAHNFWFAGGNGDFTVIPDRAGEYFYFLFGTYYKDVTQQGISLARLRFEDRFCPVGKVMKWFEGDYQEPGLLGKVTPVIPVHSDWYSPEPDTFWGPSVHWNRAIGRYVILINRAVDPKWKQEGIYISFADDIGDPAAWTKPVKILDESGWYPQVVGVKTDLKDTDRIAGETARLFIHGVSRYIFNFSLV